MADATAGSIERVAVIGAGTMGAAIAAHVANAGLPVRLLDVAPRERTPEEEAKGLALDHPEVRNRIVRAGLERIRKLKPASFMSRDAERLVTLGNLEDDLASLADADWIVEAVVERLEVKRDLLAQIEAVRKPGSLVTTNTSGLPIAQIVEGRSAELRRSFFGTHFFNPPRYMRLVEVIAGADTDPAAVARMADFASRRLGKGVVFAKDSPNFIGNRLLSIHGCFVLQNAIAGGYTVEEVDAITGPLLGRPKTATFRLQDMVGIDVAWGVASNLHGLVPDDPERHWLADEPAKRVVEGLLGSARAGDKTGSGFYRKKKGKGGTTEIESLDLATLDYRPRIEPELPAVTTAAKTRELGARVSALFDPRWDDDRGARLARAVVLHFLAYAAAQAPAIAHDLQAVDEAVRWGFSYEAGPFELWDAMGVEATAARIEAAGHPVAPWVREMLAAGCSSFYRRDAGAVDGRYDWASRGYLALRRDPREIVIDDLRRAGRELERNDSASLLDLGDGVLLLELHSKRNTLDAGTVAMMRTARARLDEAGCEGLVFGTGAADFSVGANLYEVLGAVAAGRLDAVHAGARALQGAIRAFRTSPKPVVVAVHGMALGGGCEITLGASRVVAAAETYLGLVEAGAGLVPAGGGLVELVDRQIGAAMAEGDPLPAARRILETVGTAKVSSSAAEARELGFLAGSDRIVMNRGHLLAEAKAEVLAMRAAGWTPGPPARLWAAGRELQAALRVGVWSLREAGFASEHDALVGEKIATVVAGGDATVPGWASPERFLALERDAFVALLATEKTQARIRHVLETGKPLRN